jgi:hypothetical protein
MEDKLNLIKNELGISKGIIEKLNSLVEKNNTYEKEIEDKLNSIKNELSISKRIIEKLSLECKRKDNLIRENHIEIIMGRLSGNVVMNEQLGKNIFWRT